MDDGALTPDLPRSVFVVDDARYEKFLGDSQRGVLLQDTEAMILPYSRSAEINTEKVDAVRRVLRESGKLVQGALLIRSPYETASYEAADLAIETFTVAKYDKLGNLVRLLGATRLEVKKTDVERNSRAWTTNASARIPRFGAEARASREVKQRLDRRFEAALTFDGGEPSLDAAADYLRRSNLLHDQQLRDLIEYRTGDKRLKTLRRTISGTSEAQSNLDTALSIAKGVDIGAKFVTQCQAISSVDLVVEIDF